MAHNTTHEKMTREWAADTTGEITETELGKVNGGATNCEDGAADRAIGVWFNLLGQIGFGYGGLGGAKIN
jgi:hypothetical protein